jgi:Cft2 family RNA processing exonuclease
MVFIELLLIILSKVSNERKRNKNIRITEKKLVITKKSNLNNGSLENRTMRFLEDNSWKDEIDEFAEAIICDKPIKYGTSNDALKTMQLVYTIYSADQEWAIKL